VKIIKFNEEIMHEKVLNKLKNDIVVEFWRTNLIENEKWKNLFEDENAFYINDKT
jgi:hypothetical protein